MNAEALAHAAKACRAAAQLAMRDADCVDRMIYKCSDAGAGMRRNADALRDRAIGLTVAATFMARCAAQPKIAGMLADLEGGAVFSSVTSSPPEPMPARRSLVSRVLALIGHDPGRRQHEGRAA